MRKPLELFGYSRNVGGAECCNCFVRVLVSRLLWKDGGPSLAHYGMIWLLKYEKEDKQG